MTPPVVLVYVYASKHVHSPLPQDVWSHEVLATQANTPATTQLPILVSTPGSPIAEPPRGELMSMWAFGFHAFSWSSLQSNLQGALPGPPDGCGTPNSSSSRGLIGASPLSTAR